MAALMVLIMISSKSWATFFRLSFSMAASPRPSMKAITRAVITFIIGGMVTLKNGAGSSTEDTVSSEALVSIIDGNTETPVRYEIVPAITVEP